MHTLVIGDKNLSSWSMRPWLALKESGLKFKEVQILLDRPQTQKRIKTHSPTGRVPVLKTGLLTVWDSLAICEYIHELAPQKNLWPKKASERARARSLVAEMHSGFAGLRNECSMNIQLRTKLTHMSSQTKSDIARILEIWDHQLKKSGGPFLFGDFGIADAFFAPVVMRFISYGILISNPRAKKYMKAVQTRPSVQEWVRDARKEKPYYAKF